MLPPQVQDVVAYVLASTSARLGIHCHNDTGCAVANSLAAVEAGASHVQGTVNGYGERTGNADLFAVVGNLETKLDMRVLPEGKLTEMVRVSHALADIANLPPNTHQAYVGVSAFAHKAGLHASALKVNAALYNHMDPSASATICGCWSATWRPCRIELKGHELGYDLSETERSGPGHQGEGDGGRGYTFEAADASFELLLPRGGRRAPSYVASSRGA
jgi:2-isopropylmalate synthase